MNEEQNWYRQLAALALLSASRAAVEFITNPTSRQQAGKQLREAFQEIDYDAAARAVTRALDEAASTSKGRLGEAIDTLRDRGVEAVDEAKSKAEKQAGKKKKGRKMRFLIGLAIGALVAYFILDEQRRDDLLDRLTGASGPIEQATQSAGEQVTSQVQDAVNKATDTGQEGSGQADKAASKATEKSKQG